MEGVIVLKIILKNVKKQKIIDQILKKYSQVSLEKKWNEISYRR